MDNTNAEDLLNIKENGWKFVDANRYSSINIFCEKYKEFLNACKTERETVEFIKDLVISSGFKDLYDYKKLKAGDKVFFINKDKNIFLCIIGKEDIQYGLNIIMSHADSPRLDLKPNPLYEEEGFSYLKTHYYGGIKKYNWTAIPLAIHGIIAKTNGDKIKICIGEKDDEPIFTISDLLPHLATQQMEKKLKDSIDGEALDLLVGNTPILTQNKDSIKLNTLDILNQQYGIDERDFLSSEIEIVPSLKARDSGLDRSLVVAYGHDDKLSVYTSIKAFLGVLEPERTTICVISDKEEIGSLGNTSVSARTFDLFMNLLINKLGTDTLLDLVYSNSRMLCADVDVGLDPIYASVFEKNNASYLGKGITVSKYSGSNGKEMCSDANAEYVAFIRKIFEENNVRYQVGEVGKIDIGGGGTFAYVFANKGIEVIDCGAPILSMHSPCEIASKYDIYESYRAYKAFYESK